jgi:flagellar basal-body rod protein FlgG
VVGQLTLTRFPNPGWLATDEKGYARETPQAGTPTVGTPGSGPFGLVRQGFRERHAEDRTAALVELVRDLAREGDAGGARVRVLGGK